jgi:hypothetical protein
LKRPWREVVFIALSSTLFGAIISSIACSMLHPEKLIYGFMLSNHIAVTLPIMFRNCFRTKNRFDRNRFDKNRFDKNRFDRNPIP